MMTPIGNGTNRQTDRQTNKQTNIGKIDRQIENGAKICIYTIRKHNYLLLLCVTNIDHTTTTTTKERKKERKK